MDGVDKSYCVCYKRNMWKAIETDIGPKGYTRFGVIYADEIPELLHNVQVNHQHGITGTELCGVRVHLTNKRLRVHAKNKGVCQACGLTASLALIEDNATDPEDMIRWLKNPPPLFTGDPFRAHVNLYGWDDHHEVYRMLTVDHIVPRSHGGTNRMDNLTTLCSHCNWLKGSDPTWLQDLPLNSRGRLKRRPEMQKDGGKRHYRKRSGR